jgi:hypothetical protein
MKTNINSSTQDIDKIEAVKFINAFSSIETHIKMRDISNYLNIDFKELMDIVRMLHYNCEVGMHLQEVWMVYKIQTDEDMMERRKMYLMPGMN